MTIGPILVGFIAFIAISLAVAGVFARRALRAALLIAAGLIAALAIGVAVITSQGDRAHACWDQGGEYVDGRCVMPAST